MCLRQGLPRPCSDTFLEILLEVGFAFTIARRGQRRKKHHDDHDKPDIAPPKLGSALMVVMLSVGGK